MTGKRLTLQSRARPTDPGICVLEAGASARVEAIPSLHIKQKPLYTKRVPIPQKLNRKRAGVKASN